MQKRRIIDCHSHFGEDVFYPLDGDMQEYIKQTKNLGITDCFAMSVACPKLENKETIVKPVIFKLNKENQIIGHVCETESNNVVCERPLNEGEDPYYESNMNLLHQIRKEGDIHFHFVPLLHPFFYSEKNMIKYISQGAVVFKIHGFSSGVHPKDIKLGFFRILEKLNVPIIVHIDASNNYGFAGNNAPMNWINSIKDFNIKVFFAHAGRLNSEFIKVVNNDSRYIVGMAPDALISSDKKRLDVDVDNYIKKFFDSYNENKVVFDIDYPWNVNNWESKDLDWGFLDRIKNICQERNLEKYLKSNAEEFFNV